MLRYIPFDVLMSASLPLTCSEYDDILSETSVRQYIRKTPGIGDEGCARLIGQGEGEELQLIIRCAGEVSFDL
jgi:hypothetical protein